MSEFYTPRFSFVSTVMVKVARLPFILVLLLPVLLFTPPVWAGDKSAPFTMTGKELLTQCSYKYAGKDQTSKFTVTLVDTEGNRKRNVYLRLWKDYAGEKQVLDKMMLFTEFPPESKGGAFMRTSFVPESGKHADQWIYLPVLRKIRRVTIRDPGDRFLNSDLTYEDVSFRPINADEHFYVGSEEIDGSTLYKVESTPKESASLYSKRLFWIEKGEASDWDECVVSRITYFDSKGVLLKEQLLDWQKVGGAWMWRRVVVKNIQEKHESIFEMSDVEVNSGLSNRQFSKRAMKAGAGGLRR